MVEPEGNNFYWRIIPIIIVIAGLFFGFALFNNKNPEFDISQLRKMERERTMNELKKVSEDQKKELIDYVKKVEKLGYSDDMIKRKLLEKDWDADIIVGVMEEVKRQRQ